MKYKMMAFILALTVMTWAQTATPAAPSAPQQDNAPATKDKCPCCDKMAGNAKDAHASCMHRDIKAGDNKEKESCCGGKDAMSCMKGDKDKAAASSCGDNCCKDKGAAACCGGKDCGKDCCAKKTGKTAKHCCEDKLNS